VQQMLDRLTTYEVVVGEIIARRMAPLRAALKDKLLALSLTGKATAKADCVALAKLIEDFPAQEPLNPPALALPATAASAGDRWNLKGGFWNEFLTNGKIVKLWTDGTWRWMNRQKTILLLDYTQAAHADVMFLPSAGAKTAKVINNFGAREPVVRQNAPAGAGRAPAAEGMRLVMETGTQEAEVRENAAKEIEKRRTGVARWLTEKAKTAAPAVAGKILVHAKALEPSQKGAKHLDGASALAGVWHLQDGRKMEFKPDGTVTLSDRNTPATWQWAKTQARSTALILFGKTGEATEAWLARRATSEPGVLRLTLPDKNLTARLP
jgi:hypothetical protein